MEEERNDARAAMEAGKAVFEMYYRAQGLCGKGGDGEEELASVVKAMLRPLPIAFRVCQDHHRAEQTKKAMASFEALLQGSEEEAVYWKWCSAWQLPFNDRALKEAASTSVGNDDSGADAGTNCQRLAQLRTWLTQGTEQGLIARQEIASMMPVALLDIQGQHAVLDMCASPGSKTTQAIEAIYSQAGGSEAWPSGFVVANELDAERSYVLSKRCAALRTAAASCIITCHRAQILPATGGALFDRVICDVPCSGMSPPPPCESSR
jgi:tRNA (cytosine34-C5)-methyltransferase